MSFIQTIPKNSLYLIRAASIGAFSAVAFTYFYNRNKKSLKSEPASSVNVFPTQPIQKAEPLTQSINLNEVNGMAELQFENSKPLGSVPYEKRVQFIKKVYGLICAQLAAVGFSTALAFRYLPRIKGALVPCFVVGTIGGFLSIFRMHAKQVRSDERAKKLWFGVFTLSEMLSLPFICVMFPKEIVMSALLNTGVVVGGLTAYAHTTKRDYTSYRGLMCSLLFGFVGMSILFLFFPTRIPQQMLAWAGVALFSFCLVTETQTMLGKGSCKYHYGDYDIATVALYLNVINLFIRMMEITDRSSGGSSGRK